MSLSDFNYNFEIDDSEIEIEGDLFNYITNQINHKDKSLFLCEFQIKIHKINDKSLEYFYNKVLNFISYTTSLPFPVIDEEDLYAKVEIKKSDLLKNDLQKIPAKKIRIYN